MATVAVVMLLFYVLSGMPSSTPLSTISNPAVSKSIHGSNATKIILLFIYHVIHTQRNHSHTYILIMDRGGGDGISEFIEWIMYDDCCYFIFCWLVFVGVMIAIFMGCSLIVQNFLHHVGMMIRYIIYTNSNINGIHTHHI